MSDINAEMRVTADYAISIAKERYGLELDYSDDSLDVLDNLLEKIYWGFSGYTGDEGQGGLIFNTAIIWGSYLGEYMRLKWGGTWLLKDTERRVIITSTEFSPINFIFQRITNHPEYRVINFLQEAKKVIYASVIHPQKLQIVSESAGQPNTPKSRRLPKKPIIREKHLVVISGGVLGLLIIISACIAGYVLLAWGGLPAFGLLADATSRQPFSPQPTFEVMVTSGSIYTDTPTMTWLPTYTRIPTQTPRPSQTPLPTSTLAASSTPTHISSPTMTKTEWILPTWITSPSYTSIARTKTYTPAPTKIPPRIDTPTPTAISSPTDTPHPTPTATEPPPRIISCGVDPSTVPAGVLTDVTFSVEFSQPGYGMTVSSFNPERPGQVGCSDANGDGDATASCGGSSGLLPIGDQIDVEIQTPLGNCTVTYRSP